MPLKNTSSLNIGRQEASGAAFTGYLYVVGGYNPSAGGYLNSVEFAKINSNGTLDSWSNTSSLISSLAGRGVAVYNGYIYAVGGDRSSSVFNSVEVAKINSDGSLGSWVSTSSMNTARGQPGVTAYNGYVYAAGGGPSGGSGLNSVEYAPINADGTLGSWSSTSSMQTSRHWLMGALVTYNNYIFAVGGKGDGSGANLATGAFNSVEYAPINADGTIGEWTSTSSLNTARYRYGVGLHNGYLFAVGGVGGDGSSYGSIGNTVEVAKIN